MKPAYTLTVLNSDNWNEFQHREVVFTRIKTAGDGKTTPRSQVLQIWDVQTDSLVVELVFTESLVGAESQDNKLAGQQPLNSGAAALFTTPNKNGE